MGGTRLWGYVLGGILLAVEGILALLGSGPFSLSVPSLALFWLVIAGGPVCLVVGLLTAIKWERLAGAIMWMGAAVFALGIALQSGPHVGRYFVALASFVLPQALAASLFLMHGREKAAPRRGRGG